MDSYSNRPDTPFMEIFDCAYTDPSREKWIPAPVIDFPLDSRQIEVFAEGYEPDWDCRFFPKRLPDGHFYILRSDFWCARFDYIERRDGLFHIENFVITDRIMGYNMNALANVFCDGYFRPRLQDNPEYHRTAEAMLAEYHSNQSRYDIFDQSK